MDTIAILRTLVGFDTTSRLSNLPLVHWTVAYLEAHGARIRLSYDDDKRKANALASLGPDRAGGIVLSGHTDVVPVDGDRHRGFFGYRATFHGRAAHSSDPGAGASAIYPAAEFVRFLRTAGDDGGDGIDRTTFNVGRIDGATAINIVPNRCEVVWEFRPSASSDVGAIRTTVDDFIARSVVHDVKFDHVALTSVPPLASRNDNAALKLAHGLGAELPTLAMPFGTEAGFFQTAGIPTVVCGPGSIDHAHQPDECITVAQLEAGSRFLDRLGAWASTEAPPEAGWVTGRASVLGAAAGEPNGKNMPISPLSTSRS
jgi:acetylornithine deacetylase/succinyl-diaminopimelate desuccinylase-like protein